MIAIPLSGRALPYKIYRHASRGNSTSNLLQPNLDILILVLRLAYTSLR